MSDHADSEKLVLHAGKLRNLGFLALSLVFCAGSVWLLSRGKVIGWLPLVVFGLGVVLFAINLLPSASMLVLTRDGFAITAVFRKRELTPWSHVAHFGIAQVSLNRMLGWDYVPEHRPAGKAPDIAKAGTGFEAALPDTYGMKVQDLVYLMEDWRNRYGVRGG
jgi:hypothetical protein